MPISRDGGFEHDKPQAAAHMDGRGGEPIAMEPRSDMRGRRPRFFGCGLLFWYSAIKGVKPSAPIYTIWGLLIVAGLLMVVGGLIARAFRAKIR